MDYTNLPLISGRVLSLDLFSSSFQDFVVVLSDSLPSVSPRFPPEIDRLWNRILLLLEPLENKEFFV